jgi:RNA polymerase sigma-70 factor (ECF subfamily)
MERPEPFSSLLEKARAGDREALNALAGTYSKVLGFWIFSKLGKRLRTKAGAEDLVQEVLFQAFKGIGGFRGDGEGAFWTWLKTIALRAIRREALRLESSGGDPASGPRPGSVRSREVPLDLETLLAAHKTSPSEGMRRDERFDHLQRALDSLAPDHRQVILLASVDLLPLREVARRMDRSPDAVSMLLLRAMKKLRAAYGRIESTDSFSLPRERSLKDPDERSR